MWHALKHAGQRREQMPPGPTVHNARHGVPTYSEVPSDCRVTLSASRSRTDRQHISFLQDLTPEGIPPASPYGIVDVVRLRAEKQMFYIDAARIVTAVPD